MSYNKCFLNGHLGKDPEVKHLEGGTTVAKFTLATSERYKNKAGEQVENTEWHNIICWRQLAELAEKYLTKGKEVTVIGKITNRSYEDKDKQKRYVTEIVASEIHFHGSKPEGQKTASHEATGGDVLPEGDGVNEGVSDGEELPF